MDDLHILLIAALAAVCIAVTPDAAGAAGTEVGRKPRVIATTDGERDDRCSMVRFLMYANQWDIRGLIYSSSVHHWKGDGTDLGRTWHGETWIEEQIDAYAKAYPSLKEHEAGFPTPEYLREQVFVGNIALTGDMREATPGSDRIVEVLLEPDPSPVWLQAWGGPNTIARALKTIEDEYPGRKSEVSRKVRLFLIAQQDDTYRDYISRKWPDVQTLISGAFQAIAYRWRKLIPEELHGHFDDNWMGTNIRGHGPWDSMHPGLGGARGQSSFISEGDSPSFMHLIDVGLRNLEHPGFGGWGGRFAHRERNEWRDAKDDGDRFKTIYRWAAAFQNDWAARADWCAKPYEAANHPPMVRLAHALDLKANPGDTVRLSAEGTKDPDGDALSYRWWQYKEPGSYKGEVIIENADRQQASFLVPDDAGGGDTIHIICEVTDSGEPPLTRYRRVIAELGPKNAGTNSVRSPRRP